MSGVPTAGSDLSNDRNTETNTTAPISTSAAMTRSGDTHNLGSASEHAEPYWGNLPCGQGVYNTVIGHGSNNEEEHQQRPVPLNEQSIHENAPAASDFTSAMPGDLSHGSGTHSTIAGHDGHGTHERQRAVTQTDASSPGNTGTNLFTSQPSDPSDTTRHGITDEPTSHLKQDAPSGAGVGLTAHGHQKNGRNSQDAGSRGESKHSGLTTLLHRNQETEKANNRVAEMSDIKEHKDHFAFLHRHKDSSSTDESHQIGQKDHFHMEHERSKIEGSAETFGNSAGQTEKARFNNSNLAGGVGAGAALAAATAAYKRQEDRVTGTSRGVVTDPSTFDPGASTRPTTVLNPHDAPTHRDGDQHQNAGSSAVSATTAEPSTIAVEIREHQTDDKSATGTSSTSHRQTLPSSHVAISDDTGGVPTHTYSSSQQVNNHHLGQAAVLDAARAGISSATYRGHGETTGLQEDSQYNTSTGVHDYKPYDSGLGGTSANHIRSNQQSNTGAASTTTSGAGGYDILPGSGTPSGVNIGKDHGDYQHTTTPAFHQPGQESRHHDSQAGTSAGTTVAEGHDLQRTAAVPFRTLSQSGTVYDTDQHGRDSKDHRGFVAGAIGGTATGAAFVGNEFREHANLIDNLATSSTHFTGTPGAGPSPGTTQGVSTYSATSHNSQTLGATTSPLAGGVGVYNRLTDGTPSGVNVDQNNPSATTYQIRGDGNGTSTDPQGFTCEAHEASTTNSSAGGHNHPTIGAISGMDVGSSYSQHGIKLTTQDASLSDQHRALEKEDGYEHLASGTPSGVRVD